MQRITLLGSTGSIGESTLNVVRLHPEKYQVFALTAHKRLDRLMEQAREFNPDYLVIADKNDYAQAKKLASDWRISSEILTGPEALAWVSAHPQTDTVMAAIVGAAGLLPTMAAASAGKKLLLANKEALVMSGQLFMDAVSKGGAELLPIDSEHNAIFQCLPADYVYGEPQSTGITKILLTGSGGPFLHTDKNKLNKVTPAQACAHPNWSMGKKISVDSATMMNKGLEFIEACWLFGLSAEQIEVVLHPQSVIHSMVQYNDGSVLAQLGNPDMRTPIAHALAYPERIESGVAPLNFAQLADFSFHKPDFNKYPNLALAIECCKTGQSATTALNAANEVAVQAFLTGELAFTGIAEVNRSVLDRLRPCELNSIDDIIGFDNEVRILASEWIGQTSHRALGL
ncbi:1-deoxy-D-xylulose-5-phosphate reductoisomerase [Lacimicrobium alkaliphilum]|uniref:1-deoxy-D-xylulose 5-phosphate reductoisomerase n=1 Tax=Lacimicrobium alkaliphilum TaxID=1526571 RepID=A0ABQ1R3H3_9ALTE|nr:1-deoxy-D-xylulose-5-phosphate reductoisomerase [Lacimicrobium alkaliphilum]GGD56908.1 1-deoxy-D-xylulose 5-phosphate reductoisomerase [Lacimicrobium alkaliphilum]